MRFRTLTFLIVGATLAAACSGGELDETGTSDLTRSLLAQPAGDGSSTPTRGDGSMLFDEGPRVPVEEVGFNRGVSGAPVKVVEMSDYGCGYCRQFHQETFPTLRTEFIESGMVEWKFVPYITGMFENSLVATEAAECTHLQDTEAFEVLNSRLWGSQPDWKGSEEPEVVVRAWVAELGIDMVAFDACLESDDRIDRIAEATILARQIGVRGTPTFVVIGYPPLQGALPLTMFQEILAAVHADATKDGARP
jgi:protein-disulfide isomerase